MKKTLFISLILLVGFVSFVHAESTVVTKNITDGLHTDIYVETMEDQSVLRIQYSYADKGYKTKTKVADGGVIKGSYDDVTNQMIITYYSIDKNEIDLGKTEAYIQDVMTDFLRDKNKNKMRYSHFKAMNRKLVYRRPMSDFVDNLPDNQDPEGKVYAMLEIQYYVY